MLLQADVIVCNAVHDENEGQVDFKLACCCQEERRKIRTLIHKTHHTSQKCLTDAKL